MHWNEHPSVVERSWVLKPLPLFSFGRPPGNLLIVRTERSTNEEFILSKCSPHFKTLDPNCRHKANLVIIGNTRNCYNGTLITSSSSFTSYPHHPPPPRRHHHHHHHHPYHHHHHHGTIIIVHGIDGARPSASKMLTTKSHFFSSKCPSLSAKSNHI